MADLPWTLDWAKAKAEELGVLDGFVKAIEELEERSGE